MLAARSAVPVAFTPGCRATRQVRAGNRHLDEIQLVKIEILIGVPRVQLFGGTSQAVGEQPGHILLGQHDIVGSMSSKGNCYDNAIKETFFHTLKTELCRHERYRTREEARASIFEYIEVFYNRQRLHSSLGYLSPFHFEHQQRAA